MIRPYGCRQLHWLVTETPCDLERYAEMGRSPSIVPGSGTTTAARLLARKEMLLARLDKDPAPNERAEIERLIAEINEALTWLEEAG